MVIVVVFAPVGGVEAKSGRRKGVERTKGREKLWLVVANDQKRNSRMSLSIGMEVG